MPFARAQLHVTRKDGGGRGSWSGCGQEAGRCGKVGAGVRPHCGEARCRKRDPLAEDGCCWMLTAGSVRVLIERSSNLQARWMDRAVLGRCTVHAILEQGVLSGVGSRQDADERQQQYSRPGPSEGQ